MATFSKRTSSTGEVTHQAKCRRRGFPTLSKTFQTLADAKKWARGIERAWDSGEVPASPEPQQPGTTLADVLRRYRDEVCPTHKGGAIEILGINRWLRECRSFVETPVVQLDAAKVAKWRDVQLEGRAGSSVARQMNLLMSAINLARAEWGCSIPTIKVARPKSPPHRDRVLKADEEKKLLANAGRLRPVIEFALATAIRQGELAALEWRDIDWERKTARLHTSKNGLPRDVPLSSTALAALDSLKQGDGLVFELSAESIKRSFGRLVRKLKIKNLRFHDLRHTAITRYALRGLNPLQLAVISGHKDIKMLARYTHLQAADVVSLMG
jgi:integrase